MSDTPITRWTCTLCGIVTRVEDGQDHRACACAAEFTAEPDLNEPAPPPEPPPEE